MKYLNNNTKKHHHGSITRDDEDVGAGATSSGSANRGTATTSTELDEDEDSPADGLEPPLFRSVAILPHFDAAVAAHQHGGAFDLRSLKAHTPNVAQWQVKSGSPLQYMGGISSLKKESKEETRRVKATVPAISNINQDVLREWKSRASDSIYVIPPYYDKCERRSVTTNKPIDDVLDRLYCCFKKLNLHAQIDNSFATLGFVLRSVEHVELSLLIWYESRARTSIYVEVDKRQSGHGCGTGSSCLLKYMCRILKSIQCCRQEVEGESLCLPEHQEIRSGNCDMTDRCRKMEFLVGFSHTADHQEEMQNASTSPASTSSAGGQAVSSLQMVSGLFQIPAAWSQGLELLCNISDPNKSGVESSVVVSKAILLGESPQPTGDKCCRSIHERLVSLMRSMVGDSSDCSFEHMSLYQKDCLLQSVLTCLVNALEVHAKFVSAGSSSGSMELETEESGDHVMTQFLESTKGIVACDILETLMTVVRRATTKPHHAYLAVKALFLLSSGASSARQYVALAMAADMTEGPKRCAVLQRVQEIGMQSHGLLEAECERLQRVLESRH